MIVIDMAAIRLWLARPMVTARACRVAPNTFYHSHHYHHHHHQHHHSCLFTLLPSSHASSFTKASVARCLYLLQMMHSNTVLLYYEYIVDRMGYRTYPCRLPVARYSITYTHYTINYILTTLK